MKVDENPAPNFIKWLTQTRSSTSSGQTHFKLLVKGIFKSNSYVQNIEVVVFKLGIKGWISPLVQTCYNEQILKQTTMKRKSTPISFTLRKVPNTLPANSWVHSPL